MFMSTVLFKDKSLHFITEIVTGYIVRYKTRKYVIIKIHRLFIFSLYYIQRE